MAEWEAGVQCEKQEAGEVVMPELHKGDEVFLRAYNTKRASLVRIVELTEDSALVFLVTPYFNWDASPPELLHSTLETIWTVERYRLESLGADTLVEEEEVASR